MHNGFCNKLKDRGFTMIEVLIYIGVSGLLLLGVFAFIRGTLRARNKATIEAKVEQNARYAISKMVAEIRNSTDITVVDENTLRLEVDDVSRNPVVFDLISGVLFMKEGSNDQIALTGNDVKVGDVLFTDRTSPSSADIVEITLTVTNPDVNKAFESRASIEVETYATSRMQY